jgi:hypothetical protein
MTDQLRLDGACCGHPKERHYSMTMSEAPPGDTWRVDVCADCGCETNERDRRPTGGED